MFCICPSILFNSYLNSASSLSCDLGEVAKSSYCLTLSDVSFGVTGVFRILRGDYSFTTFTGETAELLNSGIMQLD